MSISETISTKSHKSPAWGPRAPPQPPDVHRQPYNGVGSTSRAGGGHRRLPHHHADDQVEVDALLADDYAPAHQEKGRAHQVHVRPRAAIPLTARSICVGLLFRFRCFFFVWWLFCRIRGRWAFRWLGWFLYVFCGFARERLDGFGRILFVVIRLVFF